MKLEFRNVGFGSGEKKLRSQRKLLAVYGREPTTINSFYASTFGNQTKTKVMKGKCSQCHQPCFLYIYYMQ
jgi:hypothetical protein